MSFHFRIDILYNKVIENYKAHHKRIWGSSSTNLVFIKLISDLIELRISLDDKWDIAYKYYYIQIELLRPK